MEPVLKIERTGYFVVNPQAIGRDYCGIPQNHVLHYKVEIETTLEHLDSRGFIIDNNDIHNYFVHTYTSAREFRSCEIIAMAACNHFATLLPKCHKCSVGISGNPANAWLTSEVRRDAPVVKRPTVYASSSNRIERRGGQGVTSRYAILDTGFTG